MMVELTGITVVGLEMINHMKCGSGIEMCGISSDNYAGLQQHVVHGSEVVK